jgi:hypothetical protein
MGGWHMIIFRDIPLITKLGEPAAQVVAVAGIRADQLAKQAAKARGNGSF